ncbi:MAG: hypothetical protein LBV57_04270 [Candidatus Symbiothrix sp.]|jgi:hypothetical protein|nr:hypothetical protein [Candidatus Symbiothrix sp.]
MKRIVLITGLLLVITFTGQSQVKIGNASGNVDPYPFSLLELDATDRGVRLPQVTATQATALETYLTDSQTPPAEKDRAVGLLVYNLDTKKLLLWDINGSWQNLSDRAACVNVSSISISGATTYTEYGSDLVLTATSDAPAASEPFYTWYKDTEPIATGKTFTIQRNDLTPRWSGKYSVEVLTCVSGALATLKSAEVEVNIQKQATLSVTTVTQTLAVNNPLQTATFEVTAPNVPKLFVVSDADRIFNKVESVVSSSPNKHIVTISVKPSMITNSNRIIQFRFYDTDNGNPSELCTITQPATADIVDLGSYFLYNYNMTKPFDEAVNFCRSLVWNGKRASLPTMELKKSNPSLLLTLLDVVDTNYWVIDKSYSVPAWARRNASNGIETNPSVPANNELYALRCIMPK